MGKATTQPEEGEPIPELKAADWKGEEGLDETAETQAKKSDGVTSRRHDGAVLTMGATIAVGAEFIDERAWLEESDAGEHEHQLSKQRQR